ncbi:MAG: hypothetical protein PQJ60_01920 [Spirochaetales bacterium]|nr:hypothetical protein [Spirochaetales bacterium]
MKSAIPLYLFSILFALSLLSCQSDSSASNQQGPPSGGMSGGPGGGGPGGSSSGGPGMGERNEPDESIELLLRLDSLARETDHAIVLTDEQRTALIPLLENWSQRLEREKKIRKGDLKRVEEILTDIQLVCRVNPAELPSENRGPGHSAPPTAAALLNRVLEECRSTVSKD